MSALHDSLSAAAGRPLRKRDGSVLTAADLERYVLYVDAESGWAKIDTDRLLPELDPACADRLRLALEMSKASAEDDAIH